jgi:glycosyltransferase involved in cell wall biosynthesis
MNRQAATAARVTKESKRPLVLVSANSFWNIANFRCGLIEELVGRAYRVVIAAPDHDPSWAAARGAESVGIAIERSGLNPFRDILLLLTYSKLMRSYQSDVFLGFTAKPNIYGSMAAHIASVASLPNVSGLGTAFINPGPLSALVGLLYRIAFRACRIIFFQNPDDRDLFVTRGIVRAEQARLLPGSGVNVDYFQPPSETSDATCLLYVGRLLGDKGVREFVEAARLLKADHPAWRFQLLGPIDEGNRSGIGQAELDQWVADGSVEYLGEADDVRPHLAQATAVVLPSYREGLPRSLLEAAAMARPLIATDVPGNRQLVRDGVNGLLCEARDPHALAEAMRTIGEMSGAQRSAMGRVSREMVEREYDERNVIGAYLDALEQLAPPARVG